MADHRQPLRTSSRPLSAVKVLEHVSGPMRSTGRLLAELGASVFHIVDSSGAREASSPQQAGSFTYFNAAKEVIELDIRTPPGLAKFNDLAAQADILLLSAEHFTSEQLDKLRRDFARKVVVVFSPFGLTGECKDWKLTEAVFHALSGVLSQSGNPGLPPLLPPPGLAFGCANSQAVFATMLAYWNGLHNGRGEFVDFSIFEGAALCYDPGYGVAGSASAGIPAYKLPRGRPEARFRYPIIRCKDGDVRTCILARRQWHNMRKWMGEPERFMDPKYDQLSTRFQDPDLIPAIAEFFATMTRDEIEAGGKKFGVPVAALYGLSEAIGAEHFAERNALVQVPTRAGELVPLINGVVEINGERMGVEQRPVQFLDGEDIVFASRGTEKSVSLSPTARPMEGVKVLDLGVIVVGAEQGRLFADQGADVIKIETSAFPDGTRQTPFPNTVPSGFAAGNRGKRGLSLNLRSERGLALFKQLAAQSDVILSNYKPGTLEALGIDFDSLKEINPAIIVVDNSAFGPTGSWAHRMGYGPLVRATTGMTKMYRYPDDPEGYGDAMTVYPDHVGGRTGAIGALALMIGRLTSGKGGRVSVAQAEILLQHFGELIATGKDEPSLPDAPYGVFPAKGDDEWLVITVEDDQQWHALCGVIGRTDWSADRALDGAAGRCRNRSAINAGVAGWVAGRDAGEAMVALQKAGVPAGKMLRISELPEFAAFRDREVFRLCSHPAVPEEFLVENNLTSFSSIPDPAFRPAPLIAEHTTKILEERLGLSVDEVKALAADGVVEIDVSL